MTEPTPPKKSDLGVRSFSAIVMVAVAGTALWLGGWWWTGLVLLVGLGVMREWVALADGFTPLGVRRFAWVVAGAVYCGLAATMLIVLRDFGLPKVLGLVAAVIATDVGAYFAGRSIGGPKIAPKISPSKTWSGLGGGVVGAAIIFASSDILVGADPFADPNYPEFHGNWYLGQSILSWLVLGLLVAITAQAGDFFESWMKRRAGVKDSGKLIPGHGGLFDRVDGLLSVSFVLGIFWFVVGR